MKRKKLSEILDNYYSISMRNMILRGERKPEYQIMVELDKKHLVPFDSWLDIKSFITNDTETKAAGATTDAA